ncbi:MAG: hypothetical protein FJY73_06905 [Candidatus Eisenbacteria bacterium]|nr:hypothetical protein [Candidatus Eisenbacteria bacterium]
MGRTVKNTAPRTVFSLLAIVCLFPSPARAFDPLSTDHAYDYVILAHDNLATEAQRLLDHRSTDHRCCLVRISEIASSFQGSSLVEKIRAFVHHAYRNWRIAPSYLVLVGDANMTNPAHDLVPAPLRWNEFYVWHDNRWFADDTYYVESPFDGNTKPILHVGRIPARTNAQLRNAIDKILAYDALAGSPAWLSRILMLVGDASINGNNQVYKTLNDQLRDEELSGWPEIVTRYASDYDDDMEEWPEIPTEVTRQDWNAGVGYANAFGNTLGWTNLVFMAYFNLPPGGTGNPTFTESLDATHRFPVLFAGSCLMNYFYRDFELSVGEDLLLSEPDRGAAAVVAATHVNDAVESYQMNQYFIHEMIRRGVRNLGRLFTGARSRVLEQGHGHPTFARQYCLLGDPGLDIKLHPLLTPTDFANGMEIEDAPVFQDVVLARSAEGLSNDNLRIVHSDGGVDPLLSERMLRATLTDGAGAPFIEWKILEPNLPIEENTILSFWMNVPESPGGACKIVLDGNTTGGRLKDNIGVFDQNGVPLNAKYRTPLGQGWRSVYADLSSLQGSTLLDLRVRYETTVASDAGNLRAYIDAIRVSRPAPEAGEILNASFEEDEDRNGTPDFWTNLWGETTTGNVLRSDHYARDGTHSMLVYDEWCNGQGAQHVFHSNPSAPAYTMRFDCMAPEETSFRVIAADLNWGSEILSASGSAGPAWKRFECAFPNPDCGFGMGRIAIRILPEDCEYPLYIDAIRVLPGPEVGIEGASSPAPFPLFAVASPNPVPREGAARVRFDLPRGAEVAIDVFDLAGRRVARIPETRFPAGENGIAWHPERLGVSSGAYFLKFYVDGRAIPGGRKILIVR